MIIFDTVITYESNSNEIRRILIRENKIISTVCVLRMCYINWRKEEFIALLCSTILGNTNLISCDNYTRH